MTTRQGARDVIRAHITVTPDRQVSQKTRVPMGVHILPQVRTGDATRDSFARILGQMYSLGYLPHDEWQARVNAAMRAQTRQELDLLLQDLPPLESIRPVAAPGKKKFSLPSARVVNIYLCLVASFASASAASVGWSLAGDVIFAILAVAFLALYLLGIRDLSRGGRG